MTPLKTTTGQEIEIPTSQQRQGRDPRGDNTQWILFTVIAVVCLSAALLSYFSIFHGELSSASQDWSSFGSYISGVLMPILTGINIWVFIKLTRVIEKNNEKRQTEDLEFQRRKIITGLRQRAIDKLAIPLDNLGKGYSVHEVHNTFTLCLVAIDSFVSQKRALFSLNEDEATYQSLIEMHALIKRLGVEYDASQPVTGFIEILKLKHKVMTEMQQYILDNV